ncbi:MAG: hypothetical protein ABI776_13775 [Nocardioidaceae bacterium]
MTAVTRPRGPLPHRVYWTRRMLVVVVALALVFAIAHLLGGTSGGTGPSARPVGAPQTGTTSAAATGSPSPTADPSQATPTSPTSTPVSTPSGTASGAAAGRGAVATPLPQPTGTCANSDVVVVPSVSGTAYAGGAVVVTTTLTTQQSPACTWTLSARSLVVKITSGPDRIWSTQQCSGAVPRQVVTLRKDTPVSVAVPWNGLRFDADCTRPTSWAENGYYHVVAAAFGGEPTDVQFRLLDPVPSTVTRTPTPSPKATSAAKPSATPTAKPTARPTATSPAKPTGKPSGTPSTRG